MNARSFAVAAVLLLLTGPAPAWDNTRTHPRLADAAVTHADADRSLDRYLREQLGLKDGIGTRLILRRGFDSDLEREIRSRFDSGPDENTIELASPCMQAEQCEDDPDRFDVPHLLRAGVLGEDVPNPRARHHFHDPVNLHPPPLGNQGLDNDTMLPILDTVLAEFVTTFRGGNILRAIGGILISPFTLIPGFDPDVGNFDLTGRSALDRALNRSLPGESRTPSEESPRNRFALPDAERYLYRGLTAETEPEREHFLGVHFLTFGQALHLLQDMSSVAHTRNDFIVDHVIGKFGSLERAGEERPALDLIRNLQAPSGLSGSLPRAKLTAPGVDLPAELLAQFDTSIPSLDARGFEVGDFWEAGVVAGPRADAGLAELVNAQFYSRNTISNTGGYPSPFVPPDCDEVEFGAGTGATWVSELPERGEDGELIDPAGREKFLSSHLVPHLARCNFHNVPIKRRRTRDEQKRLSYSVADDSVRWDYLEILFPLTVKYTAELMDAYFTPRLDVVPLPQNRFKLVNPSPYDLSFDVSAVEIAYDGVDPGSGDILRQIVPADCSHDGSGSGPAVLLAGPEPGQPGPAGNFTCDMPQTLDVPADKRGAFLVLVRGQLGSRGDVGTPAEFDSGAKDYVLAFQQVFGWQVSAHSTDLRPVGAPREFDEDVITEVWTIAFDLEGALAGEEPKFVAVNRSAPLRQQLALTLGGEIDRVDFSSPSTEPEGTRIAFGGDVNDDSGVVGFVDPSEFYIVDLLEPSVFFQIPLPGLIPITNQEGGPKWDFDPSRDAIFYSANETGSALGEAFIVRYDVDANSSVASTMTDRLVVDSVFGNRIVALHPNLIQGPDLLLADPVTGERTHRFNMDLMTVEECEGSCLLHDSLPQGEASFSPDGNRVAFAHRPEGETNSRLYIADLTNLSGGVAPISQLGSATGVEEVAWSPDGDWIAYFSPGADGILVISAEGGDPVLVSPFGGRSIAWRPPLLLPE